jgi:hypothetical protein
MTEITPINPSEFKLREHSFQRFSMVVPRKMTPDELTNQKLYEHVANKITPFSEIRVVSEDGSFRAELLVIFVAGTDVKTRVFQYTEFENISYDDEDSSEYFVKLCGPKRWCIKKRSDGTNIKEDIPDKAAAERELSEYLNVLRT